MNLFTVNQVNQVYGLKTGSTFASGDSSYTDTKGSGNVYGGITPDGKSIYFKHAGPAGVTRSDLIDLDKIMYYKVTHAEDMAKPLKQFILADDTNAATYKWPALDSNGTYMKAGYDFILRIELDHYVGISPEDSKYWKYGMVHTGPNMTPAMFWKEMAKSLVRNMSREAVQFINVYFVYNNSGTDTVDATALTMNNLASRINTIETTNSKTIIGIAIREVEPDWILGLKQQKVMGIKVTPVAFEANRANDDGTIVYWGYSSDTNIQTYDHALEATDSGVSIVNSKLAADYEYFFHGERGDQYRMVGWPDYIPTEYMIDPSNANGYDYFQIHYSYIGSNESCQKSEKDITFLIPRQGNESHSYDDSTVAASMKAFVEGAINTLGAAAANAAISAQIADAESALNTAYGGN